MKIKYYKFIKNFLPSFIFYPLFFSTRYSLNSKFSQSGVMALPSIIVISLLILIAGIGIASSGFFENMMSYGDVNSKKSLVYAEAGAEDAFERLVKNKNCSCSSYTLNFDNGSAAIAVSGDASSKTIVSEGAVSDKKRKVQVVVSFDANDKATQISWQEITN